MTLEWIHPDELRSTEEFPPDDPLLLEWVEFMKSGIPFPGNLSPEAIFADMPLIANEATAQTIWRHCNKQGYGAHIGKHPELGLCFYRLDKPTRVGELFVDGIERSVLMDEVLSHGKKLPEPTKTERSPKPKPSKPRRRKRGTYVYFVEAIGSGRVKIGFTKSPEDRLGSIQTGCPFPLKLLAVVAGSEFDESELHERFASYRSQGEWFRLEGELQAHITTLMEVQHAN